MSRVNFSHRYVTQGVNRQLSLDLQLMLWSMIDETAYPRDELQVFQLKTLEETGILIRHTQEEPAYEKHVIFKIPSPWALDDRIFVVDNGEYTVMMLSSEY